MLKHPTKPRKIIHEALLDVHPDDPLAVANYTTAQRSVQRKRNKNNISLPIPISLENIKIHEELKLTNTVINFCYMIIKKVTMVRGSL